MNKEKINYFIYARKSTEGADRQILSIEGQLGELRMLIEREGLTVVDTYTESKSAHVPYNRPQFTEMLKRISKGEANGIITWHTNRLSRNPKESGEIQQLLQDGVIASIILPYRQFKSEDNALLFSIETSEANQYSRDLSTNVKRGLKQKCEMGQPPGSAPLGYLNTKLSTKGMNTIIPDPQRWPIIRKGFDMLLSRLYTAPQIVVILNNEYGLRTRPGKVQGNKSISRSTIYRIFTDPFYYGYFYHKGVLFKGAYEPMITAQEFDQVQQILDRNGKPRPKKHAFAFTGLMTCGACGCAVTATEKIKHVKQTGALKSYIFYHCTKRRKNCNCTEKHYTTNREIEAMIIADLHRYQLRPLFKEWAVTILKENHQAEIDKRRAMVSQVATCEKQLEQEIDNLIELRISNSITEEKFFQKKTEKEQLLLRVQQKKASMELHAKDWISEITQHLEFTVSIADKFNKGDVQAKKEICLDFGSNWLLKGKKLLIYKHEWFEPIRNYRKAVEAIFGRFEPEETFQLLGHNAALELLRPIVRGLEDEVRTESKN